MRKPRLSMWQICNLSVGLLGIQVGWGLQNANMSAIFEKLGASPSLLPLLWLAAPVTALFMHPIIGLLSDRTWTSLGRRRPYLLAGAICSSLALFLMPISPILLAAALLLWLQDASINATMEPFRPLIADKLNEEQRTVGFVMQGFFIGLGAMIATALPYILRQVGISGVAANGIPLTIQYSFQIGAFLFLVSVLWTVISTRETPPENLAAFRHQQANSQIPWFKEFPTLLRSMPATMRQLAVVQIFTWFGLFCLWMFFVPMTARHVFGAQDVHSNAYNQGVEWGGVCFATYAFVSFLVALALPKLVGQTSRKMVHGVALFCGGIGLLLVYLIHDPFLLLLPMVGVGIMWASVHSIPYAILARTLPSERVGAYMGLFTLFIASPNIVASLTLRPIVKYVFNSDPLYVVMLGGTSLLVASLLMTRVEEEAGQPALGKTPVLEREQPILFSPRREEQS